MRGLVQGVGFRMSCAARAQSLGLAGAVRNCPDGTVDAVFEGPASGVDAMVAWCRDGPPMAEVTGVQVLVEEPKGERGFRSG